MGRTRYGLKNVHYAIWNDSTSSYGEWVAIPGAVSFTANIEANTTDFYADDVVYDTISAVLKETGSAEFAALEDSTLRALLGDVTNDNGLTYTDTEPKSISAAIGYEVSGNMGKMRCVRYNVKFSYPQENANTMKESTDPDTVTMEYTAIGRDFLIGTETKNILKARCQEGSAAYDNFWSAVMLPGQAVSDTACDLATLTIASAVLSPTFDADVTSYTTTVSAATSVVTATAASNDATVVIRNGSTTVTSGQAATWTAGDNVLTVTVINGVSTKIYTVLVTKSS